MDLQQAIREFTKDCDRADCRISDMGVASVVPDFGGHVYDRNGSVLPRPEMRPVRLLACSVCGKRN